MPKVLPLFPLFTPNLSLLITVLSVLQINNKKKYKSQTIQICILLSLWKKADFLFNKIKKKLRTRSNWRACHRARAFAGKSAMAAAKWFSRHFSFCMQEFSGIVA